MLKFTNSSIVFQELPNEVTLAINIAGCPNKCVGCHSSFLQEDIGEDLTYEKLEDLIRNNDGITAVCFMGGDSQPQYINLFAGYLYARFPDIRVGWYSGRSEIYLDVIYYFFDYIKIGPYIPEFGPLNNPKTNQKLFKVTHPNGYMQKPKLIDITSSFWNNHKFGQ